VSSMTARLIAVVVFAVSALALTAPSRAEPVAGREYKLLTPAQTPEAQGKVEVLEFFSYGCPHCYAFHPMISEWAKKLPANAVFVRVPVAFGRAEWGQLVRAYYALQATGDLARLDTALFEAIHKEHQPLFSEQALTSWVAAHGVSADKFKQAFNSFNVSTRASHAEQLSRDYKVQGVPHLVIDGKYEVEGSNFDQMLANATQIVEMAAKQK
jgi:protein dithiol oxidoreductase (disulfide-forming)